MMGLTPLQKKVLDAYSRNELSSDQRLALEESLATSQQRELFAQYLRKIKKRKGSESSIDNFFESSESIKANQEKISSWTKVSGFLALVTACIAAAFYFSKQTPSYFENYYEEFPNIISPLVRGNQPEFLDSAFYFYETRQFDKAFETFGNRYTNSNIAEYGFYQAISAVELGNLEQADQLLASMGTSDYELINVARLWYGALIAIELDHTESAIFKLDSLSGFDNIYKTQAQSLLKELNEN